MGIHHNRAELAFIEPYNDCVGVWLSFMSDCMFWNPT
jgi:hypothetical protein